ncbi:transglycosylase SLT domain-containing protein [Candidatus Woesearchaeota archaeon]|nr:transglycosylase SLT domain-containing protein [Candidatus Woesearchaeota archaeon]
MVYESGLKPIRQLKTLLPQFYAEEGRAAFIAGVAGRRDIPKEYIDRAILFYEGKKNYAAAKNLAAKAGMQRKAATLEQRMNSQNIQEDDVALVDVPTLKEFAAAKETVRRYERLACDAPVEIAVDVIDAYHSLGDADQGVRVALQYGLFQKAIQIREQDQDWRDAGAIAEAHGWYERAGVNYEKAKQLGKAGDCFAAEVEARKEARKKSKNLLVAAVSYLTSIHTPEEENLMVRAAGNYIAANWQESAEKVLGKIKNKARMYAFFEKQGDFKGAEEYAVLKGDFSRIEFYSTIDKLVDPEREQQARDQRAREQQAKDQQAREYQAREQRTKDQQAREYQAREQRTKEQQAREQQAKQNSLDARVSEPLLQLHPWSLNLEPMKPLSIDSLGMIYNPPKKTTQDVGNSSNTLTSNIIISAAGALLTTILTTLYTEAKGYFESDTNVSAKIDCPQHRETIEGKLCRIDRYHAAIHDAEKKYNIPNGLLAGIAMQESSGDPTYIGANGAGLFELSGADAANAGLNVYGKNLQRMAKQQNHRLEDMDNYDSRFSIGQTTDAAAKKLTALHSTTHLPGEGISEKDSWDFAVAAFAYGKDTAMQERQMNYVKNVHAFQEYYVLHGH